MITEYSRIQRAQNFVFKVRDMRSNREEFLSECRKCPIINLCIWCPAHSHLESGELDQPVDYFCEVAHSRQKMLQNAVN
jgi:radical SAM protein with 4Fe4S-binding SPASM domain